MLKPSLFINVDNSEPSSSVNTPTPLEIEVWWLECMKLVRGLEITGSQKLDFNLVAPSINKKFNALIDLSLLEASKESIIKKTGPKFYKNLSASLKPESSMKNLPNTAMYQMNMDGSESLITIGTELLKNPNNPSNKFSSGYFNLAVDPQERFLMIFFHELGHLYQLKEDYALKGSSSPNPDFTDLDFSFHYDGIHEGQEGLLQKLISDNHLDNETSSEKPFSSKYQELHSCYQEIAKEMFADCFSVLMHSKLNEISHKELSTVIMQERLSRTYGSSILDVLEPLEEKTSIVSIDPHFSHNTAHSLSRLNAIIEERRVDIKGLDFNGIYQLCQECMNYGLTNFIYEASQVSPGYREYLNSFSVSLNQRELFSDNPKNYSIEDLFNTLSPTDKTRSNSYASFYKNHLKLISNQDISIPYIISLANRRANQERWPEILSNHFLLKNKENIDVKALEQLDLLSKINNSRGNHTNREDKKSAQITVFTKHNKKVKVVLPKVYKAP